MDIFKLIYEHDLRLDQLKERHTDRRRQDVSSSLADFLKPDLTYSKFYLTGTRLDKENFGLNVLDHFNPIVGVLQSVFKAYYIHTAERTNSLTESIEKCELGSPIIISKSEANLWNLEELTIETNSNVGHKKDAVADLLKTDDFLLYKEPAHDGFDLHLFAKNNIYRELFYPYKKLVSDQFRFFSINGKRIQSERKFYFETWALHSPPHGVEEVFEQTVL